jgi:NADH:ubiquinone oxidoreductase subunit C
MSMDAISALLAERFAGDLTDVRIQEPDTVVAGAPRAKLNERETGFESVYHVYSWKTNTYLELHVALPREAPEVDTVTGVWPAADWHERESWDMVGIVYAGHPDLRRILLKDDFVGHPLRKDYVDLAENHPHV